MGSAASTSSNGEGGKPRAVMVCHSSQEVSLSALLQAAGGGDGANKVDDIVIMTDMYPRDRQHRAELISRAQSAFVAIDPMLQRSSELIETLSFLKDQRKTVISGPLTFFSRHRELSVPCVSHSVNGDPLLFAEPERFAYWAKKYELLTRSEVKFDASLVLESVDVSAAETASSPQVVFFAYRKDGEGEASSVLEKFAHNNPVPGELSLSGKSYAASTIWRATLLHSEQHM